MQMVTFIYRHAAHWRAKYSPILRQTQ